MKSTQTVHVYDEAVETSEVLAAVYQPRGFTVQRRHALGSETPHGPTVVVLRPETGDPDGGESSPLRVVIGKAPVNPAPGGPRHNVNACELSSLFEYRELVSAIDRLLCGSD